MVEDAKFGFTEVRIGFVPAIILNFLLRTVGEKILRDLCLTGRLLPSEEAYMLGLLTDFVAAEDLEETVHTHARELAKASPEAIAATKRLFLELRPLAGGLNIAAEANARARATEDCREGIAAFLQKRKPSWAQGDEHE